MDPGTFNHSGIPPVVRQATRSGICGRRLLRGCSDAAQGALVRGALHAHGRGAGCHCTRHRSARFTLPPCQRSGLRLAGRCVLSVKVGGLPVVALCSLQGEGSQEERDGLLLLFKVGRLQRDDARTPASRCPLSRGPCSP